MILFTAVKLIFFLFIIYILGGIFKLGPMCIPTGAQQTSIII